MRPQKRTANLLILFCFFAVSYTVLFFCLRQAVGNFTDQLVEEARTDDLPVGQTAEPTEKIAYLTFDDGPSKHTAEILDILDEYGIKAAFFVNYRDASYYSPTLQRLAAEGHSIGNHTYSHEYKTIYHSADGFLEDFQKLQAVITEITGVTPDIFRYPGGSIAAKNFSKSSGAGLSIFETMQQTGYQYYDWNADGSDQISPLPSGRTVAARILDQTKHLNTALVLMHDAPTSQNTVDALPTIIQGLLDQGFTFKRLDSGTKPIAQFVYNDVPG